jgi:hypothetical protein
VTRRVKKKKVRVGRFFFLHHPHRENKINCERPTLFKTARLRVTCHAELSAVQRAAVQRAAVRRAAIQRATATGYVYAHGDLACHAHANVSVLRAQRHTARHAIVAGR